VENNINELTLLLLYLTSWEEQVPGADVRRSWKGYSFEALDELTLAGYISGNKKSKSVFLSKKGMAFAAKLAEKYPITKKGLK
jgi:hypothetical protein